MQVTYHELMDLAMKGADIEVSAADFRYDEIAEVGSRAKGDIRITVRNAEQYTPEMRGEIIHQSRCRIGFSFGAAS